ncbi:hypothetical protein LCGC14_2321130 [marine sediment metagenome]|uniref:Uncharacterized protein n=1 Tax=marine sediment metagenome TaxID=412755 RepID=A0A0F9CIC5_9ZZZZ
MNKPWNSIKLPRVIKTSCGWLAAGTVIFGFYAGASAIGLQIPRWAWYSEHIELAGDVRQNSIKMYRGDVKSLRRQLIDARIGLSRVDRDRNPKLYEQFLRDELELNGQLSDARQALERARQRK